MANFWNMNASLGKGRSEEDRNQNQRLHGIQIVGCDRKSICFFSVRGIKRSGMGAADCCGGSIHTAEGKLIEPLAEYQ